MYACYPVYIIIDLKILDSIAPVFTSSVNVNNLFPLLLTHGLLTTKETNDILNHNDSSEVSRGSRLLGILKTKGSESIQQLLCTLNLEKEHAGHKSIADELKKEAKANNLDCEDFCPNSDCKKYMNM